MNTLNLKHSDALIHELAEILTKGNYQLLTQGSVNQHQEHPCVTIQLEHCSSETLNALETILNTICSLPIRPDKDYSRYFQSIMNSPMYKPANPMLAIQHTAKTYQLDVEALKQSFLAQR